MNVLSESNVTADSMPTNIAHLCMLPDDTIIKTMHDHQTPTENYLRNSEMPYMHGH